MSKSKAGSSATKFKFDSEDFSNRLDKVIKNSDAVVSRLTAIQKGVNSELISEQFRKGKVSYALMFKGISASYAMSLQRLDRIKEFSDRIPLSRIAEATSLPVPDDEVELLKINLILAYVDTNFVAANKFVDLLTNGQLVMLAAQVENLERAQDIVLDVGTKPFTVGGYLISAAKDVGGIFAPIVSQIDYLRETLFRREREILEKAEGEASSVGKALRFCDFTVLANETLAAQLKLFEDAEGLLADFVSSKLPLALKELGV